MPVRHALCRHRRALAAGFALAFGLYLLLAARQLPDNGGSGGGAGAMPRAPVDAGLRREIVERSVRYVRELAAAHQRQAVLDGPYAAVETEYDMKKTLAVLLSSVLGRLDRLERAVYRQDAAATGRPASGSNESTAVVSAVDLVQGEQEKCPMRAGYEADFPNCDRKIEWMSHFWRSDPCYAAHGVDGGRCSFVIYLSEVEEHCPRFGWRPPKVAADDDGAGRPQYASTPASLDRLFAAMDDNPLNYDWIKRRLGRTWPAWTAAARSLRARMGKRRRKRIVLHLGFLTKETGLHFGEKSARGGPLGELVQWSDLIGALYVLGHELVLSSETATFIRFAKADPSVKTSCPLAGDKYVDLLFTDIIGVRHMKRKTAASLNKYRCRLRVLDSFGTQAEFNEPTYYSANKARLGGRKNPWAGHALDLRQFWTMYPHTADNFFLGFVVESDVLAKANAHLPTEGGGATSRRNCTVVYGKEAYMWRDAAGILDTVRQCGSELHATVSLDDGAAARYVPAYVRNHGVLGPGEYAALLAGCKVLLGLGFPLEGPAPLEAIASGAVFVNPSFEPAKGRLTDPFFNEKPTLRTLASQNPYVAEFVGAPHVRTVDINDAGELRRTVTAILAGEQPPPYLPYEFTAEGMLQRVDAAVEMLDVCADGGGGRPAQWPPLSALTVVIGADGQDCQAACKQNGLRCEPSFFRHVNTGQFLATYFNCTSVNSTPDVAHPSATYSNNEVACALNDEPALFSCGSKPIVAGGGLFSTAEKVFRLCPCRDFIKGQVALCKDCLPPGA